MAKLRCIMVSDPSQGRSVNGIVNRYGYSVVDGEKTFGKIGEIDVQVDIQSFLDSCDYRIIMESITRQIGVGVNDFDFEPLQTLISDIDVNDPIAVATYMDVLGEMFTTLPMEVKQHYENNPRKFARDCIGGGAVDFINTFAVNNNGFEAVSENAGEMATKQSGVATGNGQPDIAGIMRQIDAINQKLSESAASGSDSGAEEGGKKA